MDLYFERHDGEAATVEDFVRCMADASGRDISTSSSAGTSRRERRRSSSPRQYDASEEDLRPHPRAGDGRRRPASPTKQPLQFRSASASSVPDGEDMPLDLEGVGVLNEPLIELTEAKKTFRFRNVAQKPVLSLNRGFSAPIRLKSNAKPADQLFLMKHDSDTFNRWEAAQTAAHDTDPRR